MTRPDRAGINKILSQYKPGASIVSSVVKEKAAILKLLKLKTEFITLGADTPLPFRNRYQTKSTLGNDRIANAAGAIALFPGKNCLVIDAGTCVKYDLITARKEYKGGAISPGMQMRFQSLHEYTAKLPLVQPSRQVRIIGNTTNASIVSGVQMGIRNEMEGFIRQTSLKYKGLKVILTGGDATGFARLLNFPIFAAPNLTAIGLNEILQHHLANK